MRNASDIFCLNDNITDGYGMFSINGSCPMKIKRRNKGQQQDECFEYGGKPTGDGLVCGDSKAEREDLEQLDSARSFDEGMEDKETRGPEDPCKGEPSKSARQNKKMNFKKIHDKKSLEAITSSNMARNPLTGAGIESSDYRRSKKENPNKRDKWEW